jgi:uncharacterized protein YndB with AHSA1/START domain
MIKWLVRILAALAILTAVLAGVGYLLPAEHRASRSAILTASPDQVYAVIVDFAKYPEWRSDLDRIEAPAVAREGSELREHGANGEIPYRVETLVPSSRVVTRISDPSLPFGGTWTYELRPNGTGTELAITEDGVVSNPIFRALSRFVFGHYDAIDAYMADLQKRLSR